MTERDSFRIASVPGQDNLVLTARVEQIIKIYGVQL